LKNERIVLIMTNKKRPLKGRSVNKKLENYTVIDLETTGIYVTDLEVIEIAALRVRGGKVCDKFQTLVNPKKNIPNKIIEKTGITDEMVAGSPFIEDVLTGFLEFIGDDVLIGHNLCAFDLCILYDLSEKILNRPISNNYIDTYHLSRRCLPELQNHRLETVSVHLGIDITDHHRAEADCHMANKLYETLKPLMEFKSYNRKSKDNILKVKDESVENNFFLNKLCISYGSFKGMSTEQIKGIFCDIGARYADYFCYSADFLILSDDMHKKYLQDDFDEMIDSVKNCKNIKIISEYDFLRYADVIKIIINDSADIDFIFDVTGKTFCLTGNFNCCDKIRLSNRLVELGATVKPGVIKGLNYLVMGDLGSDAYKEGTKGGKHEKAIKFNHDGANIQIIGESDFVKFKELSLL